MKKTALYSLIFIYGIILCLTSCNLCETQIYKAEIPADTTRGICTIKIGNWDLIAIQDAHFTMPATIFPDAKNSEIKRFATDNIFDASCNVFLLKKDGKNILFDAGAGQSLSNKLEKLNVLHEDIDYILLTHFHGDHIAGLFDGDSALFPKAELWFSRVEQDAWLNDSVLQPKNQLVHKMLSVYKDRLHSFEFGNTILGNIVALQAIGHTPGHTVFEIDNLLIFGDLLHAAALQLKNPFVSSNYDFDKVQAVDTRIKFYNYASQNAKIVVGMHLPFPGYISDFSKVWK